MQPCRSYIPPAPRDTTQKPPEEPSAVAGTSCALRSWHRDLARLPFAILVAALATFASQAMCFVWLQPSGWLETRDQDDKRTRTRTVKSRTGRHHYSLTSICSSREGTATVHTSLKGDPMYGRWSVGQKEPEVEGTSGWRDFLSFRLGIQQWMARQLDLVPGGDQQRWGSHLAGEPEGSSWVNDSINNGTLDWYIWGWAVAGQPTGIDTNKCSRRMGHKTPTEPWPQQCLHLLRKPSLVSTLLGCLPRSGLCLPEPFPWPWGHLSTLKAFPGHRKGPIILCD